MGYYAYGDGRLHLDFENKEAVKHVATAFGHTDTNDFINNIIYDEIYSIFDNWFSRADADGFIDVCLSNGKYYEDEIIELLDKLKPMLLPDTCIKFTGEEGAHWRFITKTQGTWEEENGEIVYPEADPECDSKTCVFAHNGYCRCKHVHGREAIISDQYDTGCSEYVCDPRKIKVP